MTFLDIMVFYVPPADTDRVLEALFVAGAGRVGNYDRGVFVVPGRGQFRPLQGANPAIGNVGDVQRLDENRVELTFPRELRGQVVQALREAHPYEEPAFHVLENAVAHTP